MIKEGDVVRLKSGGPLMTVGRVSLDTGLNVETAKCMWFVDGVIHENFLETASLKKGDSLEVGQDREASEYDTYSE